MNHLLKFEIFTEFYLLKIYNMSQSEFSITSTSTYPLLHPSTHTSIHAIDCLINHNIYNGHTKQEQNKN